MNTNEKICNNGAEIAEANIKLQYAEDNGTNDLIMQFLDTDSCLEKRLLALEMVSKKVIDDKSNQIYTIIKVVDPLDNLFEIKSKTETLIAWMADYSILSK